MKLVYLLSITLMLISSVRLDSSLAHIVFFQIGENLTCYVKIPPFTRDWSLNITVSNEDDTHAATFVVPQVDVGVDGIVGPIMVPLPASISNSSMLEITAQAIISRRHYDDAVHTGLRGAPEAGTNFTPTIQHQNEALAAVNINGSWTHIWNCQDDPLNPNYWLLDWHNPQQLNVTSIKDSEVELSCYVCAQCGETLLGNYTLYLYDNDTSEPVFVSNLNLGKVNQAGIITVNVSDEIIASRFALTFTFGPHELTSFNRTFKTAYENRDGQSTYLNKSRTYHRDLYLNEVHIPSQQSTNKTQDKFWIELIGEPWYNLTGYILLVQTINGDITNSKFMPLANTTLLASGYRVIQDAAGALLTVTRGMVLPPNPTDPQKQMIHKIFLLHNRTDGYVIQDQISFSWSSESSGDADEDDACKVADLRQRYCRSPSGEAGSGCEILSLNFNKYGPGQSISRCGLEKRSKDPNKMAYWQMSVATYKKWNKCLKPCAFLKQISFNPGSNNVTVATTADLPSLTNTPLMLILYSFGPGDTVPVLHQFTGADTRLATKFDTQNITITLIKQGNVTAGSSKITATGGRLVSFDASIEKHYALGLVSFYGFLPIQTALQDLNVTRTHLIDIFVYSQSSDIFYKFLDVFYNRKEALGELINNDRGQFVIDISNPVYVNTDKAAYSSKSWRLLHSDLTTSPPNVLWLLRSIRSYIRMQLVSTSISAVSLSLAPLPKNITDLSIRINMIPLRGLRLYSITSKNGSTPAPFHTISTDDQISLTASLKLALSNKNWLQPNRSNKVFVYQPRTDEPDQLDISLLPFNKPDPDYKVLDSLEIDLTISSNRGKDWIRCFSQIPHQQSAFEIVPPNSTCQVPNYLFIYKVCNSNQVGVALNNRHRIPTDRLYLYQVDKDARVIRSAPVSPPHSRSASPMLADAHTIVDITLDWTQNVSALLLGWLEIPPLKDQAVPTTNIDIVTFYSTPADLKDASDLQLQIATKRNGDRALLTRPPMMNLGGPDLRKCIISCDAHRNFTSILSSGVDIVADGLLRTDQFCLPGFLDEPAKYKDVRISEINAFGNTWLNIGEFVELSAPKKFNMTFGLSLVILTGVEGHIEVSRVIHMNTSKAFFQRTNNSWFVFTDYKSPETPSTQKFDHMKWLTPRTFAAVGLTWGLQVWPKFLDQQIDKTMSDLEDLFLDVVIFASAEDLMHGASMFFVQLGDITSGGAIVEYTQGNGSHSHGVVGNYTISRCFCNEPRNMNCFEMSFTETQLHPNYCPTLYRKKFSICAAVKAITAGEDNLKSKILDDIQNQVEKNFTFSTLQVKDLSICTRGDKYGISYSVGFPKQEMLASLDGMSYSFPTVECGDLDCTASQPSTHPQKHAAMVAGVVVSVIIVLIVCVVVIFIVRRRRMKLRNLTTRFDMSTDDDDDDSFLPNGTISFQNPWYNQANSSNGSSYAPLNT